MLTIFYIRPFFKNANDLKNVYTDQEKNSFMCPTVQYKDGVFMVPFQVCNSSVSFYKLFVSSYISRYNFI